MDAGVRAVLSQLTDTEGKVHPCAFFSRRLSAAEKNYDIGYGELLAVKLALEECRHWLEGSKHPFVVLANHKKLKYLRSARQLNSCQAHWALFFARFNFTLSYRPGSCNKKADALSHQFNPSEDSPEPDFILLATACLATARLGMNRIFWTHLLTLLVPQPVLTVVCMYPKTYSRGFSSSATPPSSPVNRASPEPGSLWSSGSGGSHCSGMLRSLWPPARTVHRQSPREAVLVVSYVRSPCQVNPGPIFLWTSSPDCHPPTIR